MPKAARGICSAAQVLLLTTNLGPREEEVKATEEEPQANEPRNYDDDNPGGLIGACAIEGDRRTIGCIDNGPDRHHHSEKKNDQHEQEIEHPGSLLQERTSGSRWYSGDGRHIGPGLDLDAQPDAAKRGSARAFATGFQMLSAQLLSRDWATVVNVWRYPPANEGRAGDDFLLRAADQSLAGTVASDPAEGV